MRSRGATVAGSVWLIWLLTAQGVLLRANSAPSPCATGCPIAVEPVCGTDRRSYINSCVAACAEVHIDHEGYCAGEKLHFISPISFSQQRSSSTAQVNPNWRLARESAQVIHTSTINKFIDEGYVYRGRVALSSLPAYLKESSAGAVTAAQTQSVQSQPAGSASSSLPVSILRIDNKGNVYQKTFNYDSKRFAATVYPPFDPSGVSTASGGSAQVTSDSSVASSSPPLSMNSAPAAAAVIPLTPSTSAGPPIISRAAVQAAPAATSSNRSSGTTSALSSSSSNSSSSGSSSNSSTSGSSSKSSSSGSSTNSPSKAPSPPANTAAPPGRSVPSPTQQPSSSSKPAASLPPASQAKPAPAAPSSAPAASARPAGQSSGSSSSSTSASQPKQQFKEAITGAGSGAGFTNTPPAAAADELFSMVKWSSSGASSNGVEEVLKPESGSYTQEEAGQPLVTKLIDSSSSLVVPEGVNGLTAGISSATNSTGTEVIDSNSSVPTAKPIVTVHGNASQPGGTITTVTFTTDEEDTDDDTDLVSDLQVNGDDTTDIEPECSAEQLLCADKVTGFSRYFGTKPSAAKYMDQVPMVGKGRISGLVLYYNKTSGCLRGMQVMYNYVDHPSSYYTSVLLGNTISKPSNIVVKTMMLGLNESIISAEVYAPKCVQHVKLFTNRNNTVLVGTRDKNATVFTPTRNRPEGKLVAIRGFQDRAIYKAATATTPATTNPGVLKQLQFVWGAKVCNCTDPTTAAPKPMAANRTPPEAGDQGSTNSSRSGRRLAQVLQRAAASSVVLKPEEQEELQHLRKQEWQRQRQQHKIWRRQQLSDVVAQALAGLPFPGAEAADDGGLDLQAQQLPESRPSTLASMFAAAALGMDGNLPAYDGPSTHRMLSVIAPDSRRPCPVLTYPFQTLGQINAKASDGGFVCSGGLIGPDRVLTAGHCVWDDRGTQGPFKDLAFAPAQWKKDGKITAPLGKVEWDFVTLFEAYVNDPDGEGLGYDVAVITLSKPIGQQLGYLGIRADPSPCSPSPLSLTLAGYPGDDPEYPIPGGWQGGCFYDVCQVNFSCSVSITNHTCDSYVGQSGAPMYDKQNLVRAVHTLGVLPGFSTTNGAITIQKFILDNVMGYWKETSGFTPVAPGSVGTGSYY